MITPKFEQALGFCMRQHQPWRLGTFGEELAREWLKADCDRSNVQRPRTRHGAADQCAMTQVQAIKGTDACHASLRAGQPGALRMGAGVAKQVFHDDRAV